MRIFRRKAKVCEVHGVKYWPVWYGLPAGPPPKGVLLGGCMVRPGGPRSACPECWSEARA
jgi:hypothetical protein